MKDVIADIFDDVYNAVTGLYPDADLSTHYVNQPPCFPHLQLWEESNTAGRNDMNLNNDECFNNSVIHLEGFDNLLDGEGIDRVKSMFNAIDPILRRKGYRRTYYAPVPNFQDATVYREIARYSGKQPN